MLETILGIFGSAAGGGIIGLLGVGFKSWMERKEREDQRAHDRSMRDLDFKEMRLDADLKLTQTEAEFDGKARIADIEALAAMDIADAELRGKSYEHDKATYSEGIKHSWFVRFALGMVDVFRGLMRPGITTYLLVLESLLAWELLAMVNKLDILKGDQAVEMLTTIVMSVVFLTSTSITWWFGSRPNKRAV